jgi:hypothetical protein
MGFMGGFSMPLVEDRALPERRKVGLRLEGLRDGLQGRAAAGADGKDRANELLNARRVRDDRRVSDVAHAVAAVVTPPSWLREDDGNFRRPALSRNSSPPDAAAAI